MISSKRWIIIRKKPKGREAFGKKIGKHYYIAMRYGHGDARSLRIMSRGKTIKEIPTSSNADADKIYREIRRVKDLDEYLPSRNIRKYL